MQVEGNFYRRMLGIAIPIAIQSLIISSLNTLDTVMISTLGTAPIAGVGLANQVFFFFTMICFGIGTGASVMISQFNGRGDQVNVKRTNALAWTLSVATATVFTIAAFFFPHHILAMMIKDPAVIKSGAAYLQVVSLSYVLTGFSFTNGIGLRSTGNAKAPLMASIISFGFNAFFNYVLIFGKFGFPQLGVVGAASGTIMARIAEMAVIIYVGRQHGGILSGIFRDTFAFDKTFLAKYFRITSPVIINETLWGLGQVFYSIAFAMVGTQATAAIQVGVAVQNIAFVIIRGLSNSCTIMLGNAIGRGHMDRIFPYAMRFMKMGTLVSILVGLTLYLTPTWTLALFGSLTPELHQLAASLLQVMGCLFIFRGFNSVLIVGVLRGGGDTRYSMYLETFSVWGVGVPLAFIGAALLHLPIQWVLILAAMEEVTKSIIGSFRMASKHWIHVIE